MRLAHFELQRALQPPLARCEKPAHRPHAVLNGGSLSVWASKMVGWHVLQATDPYASHGCQIPHCRTATLLEHVGKREACHDGVGGDAAYPAAELTTGIMPIGHVSSSYG